MATYGIERDTLKNFTWGGVPTNLNFLAANVAQDSDVIALFSKPIEDYRLVFSVVPTTPSGITALDVTVLGSIDGTHWQLLAEFKHGDANWSATEGEQIEVRTYCKFVKAHTITVTGVASPPLAGSIQIQIIAD